MLLWLFYVRREGEEREREPRYLMSFSPDLLDVPESGKAISPSAATLRSFVEDVDGQLTAFVLIFITLNRI